MKRLILALLVAAVGMTASAQQQYTEVAGSSTQAAEDPNLARAELMFNYVLNNQADSLYANMSDQVKAAVEPQQLNGLLTQVEAQLGKYQSHEPWGMQQIMGHNAYVSLATFEKGQLGMLIVFDKMGKMLGINMVPPEAVKKN